VGICTTVWYRTTVVDQARSNATLRRADSINGARLLELNPLHAQAGG